MPARHPSTLSRPNRRRALAATLAAPALWLGTRAWAQGTYPSRPITLVTPWPAGGSSDAVMRAFGQAASRRLGVPIVIENRPGVGGTLGAAAMVQAKPDGYTITQLPLGIYRLPHMQPTPFDPLKDLTHVVCLTGYTFGIVCRADAPFKTIHDLVNHAKANPGQLEYGHTGTGTTPHLAIEEFSQKAGIRLNPVPFKGSAEIMQAILGGHIRVMSGTTEFAPHVLSGKLRLLVTLGRQRSKGFPDVPTVKESGWDTITESPFGIGGPAGMPAPVVATLHDAFKAALQDADVQQTLDRFYMPSIYMSTADYQQYAQRTYAAERATIERLGLARQK
ncbi:MAG: tripartite tricarboxylate transporter substrate binding protein [Pseudomonadota bacterium]|nr:tripartite tricarboxylate transporter substrate binding protein [Pseudomonadota bacterium]